MEDVVEHAGFFAAHAIWCVSDGGPLTPMLAFQRPGGERGMIRLAAERLEVGVEKGREWLADNSEGATLAVLIYDGFITLESGKTDALFIEAVRYRPIRTEFKMAVPYRNSDSPQGFAVYRPKFLDHDDAEPDFGKLGEAFFHGVDRHEEGAKVWNASFDQSR
jgi:hypothetical protein